MAACWSPVGSRRRPAPVRWQLPRSTIPARSSGARAAFSTRRAQHTATLLSDGKVLVAGGGTDATTPLASAELYDPAAGIWTTTGAMVVPQMLHTATLLRTNQVLVAGVGSERYDPSSGTRSATSGAMILPRLQHTANLQKDGHDPGRRGRRGEWGQRERGAL
ncbi:kelch repeat-containing protein [Robbsia betulipollinis]|uniref:kelch repeat-containing protein n=1 Tax=Robbsia betulipollinis TaxID=2981849 RepID=UPI003D7A0C9F